MRVRKPETLQSLAQGLPSLGSRKAVGLRKEFSVRWWSYDRLYRESRRVARSLKALSIQPGERIILWGSNSPEWVSILLGASLRGIVVVPIDDASTPDHVKRIAEDVNPKLVIYGSDQDSQSLGLPRRGIYSFTSEPEADDDEDLDDEDLVVDIKPDAAALILYTSGTTSTPKGVILTHGNLMAQIERFRYWRLLVRIIPFRLLSIAPLSHVNGLILGICVPLSIGLGVIYTHSVSGAHLIRIIRDNHVTLLATVPRVLQLLGKALEARAYGRGPATLEEKLRATGSKFLRGHYLFMQKWRVLGSRFWVVFVGGATLPEVDEQFWRDTGCILIQGYGLTETAAIVSVTGPFTRRVGSIAKPLANQNVRISEDGEILVSGPNVTPGYYRNGSFTKEAFSDGFLRTGDVARRDSRNRLYFLGRKKDLIVTGEGFNVYPQEVEAVLNRSPSVFDSVVVPLERDGYEEVHAVLLLANGADPIDIIRRANAQLERHQIITSWTVWPESDFPRASLLKINRTQVADYVSRRGGVASTVSPSPRPTIEDIQATEDRKRRLRLLARYVAETPRELLMAESSRLVEDLGLNSIDVVELLILIEQQRQTVLENAFVPAKATVADLYGLIASQGRGLASGSLPSSEPRWSESLLGSIARAITRPVVIGIWSRLMVRLTATGGRSLDRLRPPIIVAATPHRHWLDTFAIYSALPFRLRVKMFVVTNRDFSEFFGPIAATTRLVRLMMGMSFYFLIPLVFRFTILSHFGATREGLYKTGSLLEKGYSVMTFPKGFHFDPQDERHDAGVAMLAIQAQVPILPVVIDGNDKLKLWSRLGRPRLKISLGEVIPVTPETTVEQLTREVEDSFNALTRALAQQPEP